MIPKYLADGENAIDPGGVLWVRIWPIRFDWRGGIGPFLEASLQSYDRIPAFSAETWEATQRAV